ncbi:MAG TPA: hypothetical protein VFY16_02735, partial [Gemmatimonadaceae bacterium]|nr:hypothetical protein [Gemmatimonadaceae bacterium]
MSGTPLRHDYAVYGGRLRSALAFDAVPATGAAPHDWTLDVAPPTAPPADARLLGEATYAGGATMRLWRHASGLTLQTSDVGAYELADGGATLTWRAASRGRADVLARFDVLGRVLPLALHQTGLLCLHAGGVVLPAGAVALVAP